MTEVNYLLGTDGHVPNEWIPAKITEIYEYITAKLKDVSDITEESPLTTICEAIQLMNELALLSEKLIEWRWTDLFRLEQGITDDTQLVPGDVCSESENESEDEERG